jgi:hypothetical protein
MSSEIQPFPDPSNATEIKVSFGDGIHPQCMLEGLRNVIRTGNPDAAQGKFIAEDRFFDASDEDATHPVVLHCAAKAMGRCGTMLIGQSEANITVVPVKTTIASEQVEELDCPQRGRLD